MFHRVIQLHQLAKFEAIPNCPNLYPNARANSNLALDKLRDEQQSGVSDLPNINLNNNEINQLVAFLQALTDPCITDPQCLAPWIADSTMTGPDGEQLNAVDEFLAPL